MTITVMFDGGCSMANRVAAGAAVAYSEEGVEVGRRSKFLQGSERLRITTPIAEYTALVVGLQLALALGARDVKALGDAELVVRQVDGRYRCKSPILRIYLALVRSMMLSFDSCYVMELPKAGPHNKRRWGNVEADALASKTMKERRDL